MTFGHEVHERSHQGIDVKITGPPHLDDLFLKLLAVSGSEKLPLWFSLARTRQSITLSFCHVSFFYGSEEIVGTWQSMFSGRAKN
jgi:hypothetical protein